VTWNWSSGEANGRLRAIRCSVARIFQILPYPGNFLEGLGYRLHLPGFLGVIDNPEAIVAKACHPLFVACDPEPPSLHTEHVVKENIV
jgi:hypothetical protein